MSKFGIRPFDHALTFSRPSSIYVVLPRSISKRTYVRIRMLLNITLQEGRYQVAISTMHEIVCKTIWEVSSHIAP